MTKEDEVLLAVPLTLVSVVVLMSGVGTTTPALLSLLPRLLDELTNGQFSIASLRRETVPDYLLVHDRRDGTCWLWSFADGMRFIEASEPVLDGNGFDAAEKPRLLGP